jgi:divalent metal cation (Fe/Co/Zn/Cd) transporter
MRAHLEPILADVVVPDVERFPKFREDILLTLTNILAIEKVREVDLQMVSGKIRCAIRVGLPGETMLSDGHHLAEEIEREILNHHEMIDRVLVHVEPEKESM